MGFVEFVVENLLKNLGDALIKEARFLSGVRDEVEWLEAEFERMEAFLEDADAKQEGDRRVKRWVRQVRDAAYDTEDVIDTFVFKIARLRQRGFVGRIKRYAFIFSEWNTLHKVGSDINRIKNKIRAISESRLAYGIENIGQGAGTSSAGRSLQEWRFTSPNVPEPDFVGFEEDLKALVARLIDERELRRRVVSVVGMGGLGKTTLTKKLYNTESVKKHFESLAWISVSQEYAVTDLLRAITKCCMVLSEKEQLEKVEKMSAHDLRDNISKYLNDKRYLVVLDDLWTNEAWDNLKHAFPENNKGSRVVLTTRNQDVALYADVQSKPHELRFLNNEESWDLFCKKAFPGGSCPPKLEELGRHIVEKCSCLPLAIVVIAGLLSRKEPSESEWENVRKSITWQFVQGEMKISSILSLSYKNLPYHLKPCFLYLGIFPEDYEFGARKLIQLWAAEGLLQQRGDETLEEVGYDYLKELIQRNMIQLANKSSSGGIKSCRIHDLLRDLSISEAKEEKFLQIHHENVDALSTSTACRFAIHYNALSKCTSLKSSTPHLRSVLIHSREYQWKTEKFPFGGLTLLRVLDLHNVEIKKLPSEIGALIHLRYLRCSTSQQSLPSSMGNLHNLQTLNMEASMGDILNIPSVMLKMQQLRHFQVKYSWGSIKGHPRLDRISNLQTLSGINAGEWMHGCLRKFTNLRKLGIRLDMKGAYADVLCESILKLECIQSLFVEGDQIPSNLRFTRLLKLSKLHLVGKLEKLPESTEFPTNLTKLTLQYTDLKQDPLVTLEKLKNLRILGLLDASYVGAKMACSAQGFPLLESLHFERLYDLKEWRVEEGSMPNLLHLRIEYCPELKKLPEGLRHVSTLKKLELWYMNPELKARLQENEGEDWHKIGHIPSIDISYNDLRSTGTSSPSESYIGGDGVEATEQDVEIS